MKNLIFTLLIFSFTTLSIYAQMYTLDPQSWWSDDAASINNLHIEINPIGTFVETTFTFDLFTANSGSYVNGTLLEFVFDMKLDQENLSFNDSWLWINDYISKGVIYEAAEGTEIYEGIVDRQQDPSILKEFNANNYQLRVYPLDPDSTRRVKLSYLAPMNINDGSYLINLPVFNFNNSHHPLENVLIDINLTDEWMEPELESPFEFLASSLDKHSYKISSLKEHHTLIIPIQRLDSRSFMSTYHDAESGENYYQMYYTPEIENTSPPEYHLYLIDYDDYHSYLSLNGWIDNLKDGLNNSGYNQKFNFLYSSFSAKTIFPDWNELSSSTIDYVSTHLTEVDIDTESNLLWLLGDAIDIINQTDEQVHLHIISSNDEYGNIEDAESLNTFIEEELDKPETIINIYDACDRSPSGNYINGDYYRGNQYAYSILNSNYQGLNYQALQGDELSVFFEEALQNIAHKLSNFNFHVSLEDGFSYDNLLVQNLESASHINVLNGITILGKYYGDSDLELELSGFIENTPTVFKEGYIVSESITSDSMTQKIWAATFINRFEENSTRYADVLDLSKDERILSRLTTFLCLEPDTITVGSGDEGDEVISFISEQSSELEVKLSPNPTTSNFSITLGDQSYTTEDIRLELIDARGAISNLSFTINSINNELILDSSLDEVLPDGIYYLRIILSDQILTKKIIKISLR